MVTLLKCLYYDITSVAENVLGAHPFFHPRDTALPTQQGWNKRFLLTAPTDRETLSPIPL